MAETSPHSPFPLPDIRGKYTFHAPLGAMGWFRCGGTADVIFRPADLEDLQQFLRNCPMDLSVRAFGVLSNTIIRDGGVRGVIIRMGREFAGIDRQETTLTVGAAALDVNIAQLAADEGLEGLEFLSGIPGTIGGGLRMNAGAYGREIKDVLQMATAIDRTGTRHTLTPAQMGLSYRHCTVPEDFLFTGAVLRATPGDPATIIARMEDIKTKRAASQPIRSRTGGSTFANPTAQELESAGLPPGTKTWQLVDQVGGRGLVLGGAQISDLHCNFLINTGAATAYDLESLGEEIRRRVVDRFGISLRWEIQRVGDFATGQTPPPTI